MNLNDFAGILENSLASIKKHSRVLAIISDKTRDDNTHQIFPLTAEILSRKMVAKFDVLAAQGTHAPMTESEKLAKIGVKNIAGLSIFCSIFDHKWDNQNELASIGELSAEQVKEITNNLIETLINLTVNKLISTDYYDFILIFGATVPHEVAGFAGGAKYFFSGVSDADLTHATPWLGALSGIENTIGRIETPTRHLMEIAADFIEPEIICLTSVVSRDEKYEYTLVVERAGHDLYLVEPLSK